MSNKNLKPGRLEVINQKGREPIQPPRLVGHIQKESLKSCEHLLAHLFSATDDLFYDLSKRASSNNEQNLYFEAMREIRIRREGIANGFLRLLAGKFSTLIDQHENPLEWGEDDGETGNLSIVEGDVLEVDLARSNMVSRARDLFKQELFELNSRMDHLLLQVRIDEDNNPLDPKQLADIFIEVCQDKLEVNIKAKLILYKLFEKHVLKQLGHLYADANQILMEAGILPKVPKELDRNKVLHGGAHSESQEGEPQTQFEEPATASPSQTAFIQPSVNQQSGAVEFRMGYDALSVLMAAARNLAFTNPNQPGAAPQGQAPSGQFVPTQGYSNQGQGGAGLRISGDGHGGVNCYVYTQNPGPVMAAPVLTDLLTQSQPSYDQSLAAAARPQNIVADVVQQLLTQQDPQRPQALEQGDEDVINLVAMFFDQISNDDSLPVAVQSLIFRLQIPILKVAIKDRSFFSNPEHPARRLINLITDAGAGFDENKPLEKDPLFKKIAESIQTINRQYKTDDRVFSEAYDELQQTIEKDRRKSKMVEERTTQTETGKSRIRQARTATQSVMYDKLKDIDLPDEIKNFLTTHWLQVMVITYLKNGVESSEWVSNEQTISDLIWISSQHSDQRSKQRRDRLYPELMDRIEFGLEAAIDNPDIRSARVAILEKTLKDIHQEESPQEQSFTPLNEEQKSALGKGEDAPKSWQEMTAVERQKARYEELSSQYFEQAKNMAENTWFDYQDEDSGKRIRCKLTSKIDADTYIFVNRMGMKALEKTRKQFAYDLQFGRARFVDTSPFFDRMMKKVVTNLKDPQEGTED